METKPDEQAQRKVSFKLVGHVVMAMKRFQAALNPQYSYGKRPASPTTLPALHARNVVERNSSGKTLSGKTLSGKTLSGRPTHAGKQHGFKGNLLFKPLPPLASEQQDVTA